MQKKMLNKTLAKRLFVSGQDGVTGNCMYNAGYRKK